MYNKEELEKIKRFDFYNLQSNYTPLYYELMSSDPTATGVSEQEQFPISNDTAMWNFTLSIIDGKKTFYSEIEQW